MEATKTIKTSPSQGWKQGKGHLWPTCWLLAWTEPDRGGGRRLIDSGCLVHASQKIWGGKQLLGALWPRLSRAEDFEFQEVSCFLSLESGRHHTLSPRTVQNFKTEKRLVFLLNFQSDFIDFIVNLTLSIDIGIQSLSATLPHPQLLIIFSKGSMYPQIQIFLSFFKRVKPPDTPLSWKWSGSRCNLNKSSESAGTCFP